MSTSSTVKFDGTFLRSKVARRVFFLFILCALLPITVLAIVSFGQVTRELREQSQKRLHQASKAVGMPIYERLLLLDAELKLIARELGPERRVPEAESPAFDEDLRERFVGLAVVTGGTAQDVFGHVGSVPGTSETQRVHLWSGKTLVTSDTAREPPSRVFMSRALRTEGVQPAILVGELKAAHLWGLGEHGAMPAHTDMCVLDDAYTVHVCSFPGRAHFRDRVAFNAGHSVPSSFEYRREGTDHLASFWSIPLKFRFASPTWTVVLSEPKAAALAPLANFKYMFSLVLLLSLWVVALLSLI